MNEIFGEYSPKPHVDESTAVETVRSEIRDYRERGVLDMIGPAYVKLANAYEHQANNGSSNPSADIANEVLCRIEAAEYLSMDSSTALNAWEQRHHALTDLLDKDGQVKNELSNHPRLSIEKAERVKQEMETFEFWSRTAKTPYGLPRYSKDLLRQVSVRNSQLRIGGVNPNESEHLGV